jgi:hypothetical protein
MKKGLHRHPRVITLQQAAWEFDSLLLDLEKKYNLSASELFYVMSRNALRLSELCARLEREDELKNEGEGSEEARTGEGSTPG